MPNVDLPLIIRRSVRSMVKIMLVAIAAVAFFLSSDVVVPQAAVAYPFWAQQTAPETPREATGRIVCANCHLAAKPTEVELPQSVLPDTVFEAVVKIPYDHSVQQVTGDGSLGPLNVGAVVMLPEGFTIAPPDRIPEEIKEKVGDVYFQPYREDQDNVFIVGPLPGDQYEEIVFPVLSPDPDSNKSVHFGKYSVHVGANRGRGQLYPTGEKTNNTVYNAPVAGTVTKIEAQDLGGYVVTIQPAEGDAVTETIPPGPELVVSEGQEVIANSALTKNPNVGGFGQVDKEIVLQSAARVQWLIAFFVLVMITQVFLALKKKQMEKIQAAESNF